MRAAKAVLLIEGEGWMLRDERLEEVQCDWYTMWAVAVCMHRNERGIRHARNDRHQLSTERLSYNNLDL